MTEYNKLVRDKIPEIIVQNGEVPTTRILSEEEYMAELIKKATEEARELADASSIEQVIEELADLEKVVLALKGVLGAEKVDQVGRKKDAERGGFDDRIFLVRTEN